MTRQPPAVDRIRAAADVELYVGGAGLSIGAAALGVAVARRRAR
jgi:hypothetical protein